MSNQLSLPLNVFPSPSIYKPKFPSYDPYWDEIVEEKILTVDYEDITVSKNNEDAQNPLLTVDYEDITVSKNNEDAQNPLLTVDYEDITVSKNNEDAENPLLTVDYEDITVSKRKKGMGTGRIQWRIVYRNGKSYKQAWYDFQEHQHQRDKILSRSRYIPKQLVKEVEMLEMRKAPVKEILRLLGLSKNKHLNEGHIMKSQ